MEHIVLLRFPELPVPMVALSDKPVGTIYIGVIVNEKKVIQRYQFEKNRIRNIERAAMAALNMLRINLIS